MRMPTQEEIQEIVTKKVAAWLIEECEKLWGENSIKEDETIEDKLREEGYELDFKSMGMVATYLLKKDERIIAKNTMNIMTITMEAAKKGSQ